MILGDHFGGTGVAGSRPDMPEHSRVLVIADDLTGACDAAVAFAVGNASVHVMLDHSAQPGGDGVWAIHTESRDLPPKAAADALREAARRSLGVLGEKPDAGPRGLLEIFKKIDSVLRGNTFVEIAGALKIFPFDLAVIAPAYPTLGRQVIGGKLVVNGQHGESVDLCRQLAEFGCELKPIAAGIGSAAVAEAMQTAVRDAAGQTRAVVLCDAATQADLRAVVEAARTLPQRILWIGSGGLAHALAAEFPVASTRDRVWSRCGTVLFFIGSDHPVTRAQVAHLHREAGLPLHSVHTASNAAGDRMISVVRGSTTEEEIRHTVSGLEPHAVACLFMTGGDTAVHVCRALGITSLKLWQEFAPGVPLGLAEGGRFDGVPVILKSGGFGDENLLHYILTTFADAAPEAMTA